MKAETIHALLLLCFWNLAPRLIEFSYWLSVDYFHCHSHSSCWVTVVTIIFMLLLPVPVCPSLVVLGIPFLTNHLGCLLGPFACWRRDLHARFLFPLPFLTCGSPFSSLLQDPILFSQLNHNTFAFKELRKLKKKSFQTA